MKSSGLLKSFIFNTIGGVPTIVVALVAIPLYLHTIGAACYGALSIVCLLFGYFSFLDVRLDVRLSRTSTNALSKLRPDSDLPNRPFNRALCSYAAWVSVTNLLRPLLESLYQSRAGSMFGVAANPDVLLLHHGANVLTSYGQYAGLPALSERHPRSSESLTAQPWLVSHGFTRTCQRNPLAFQNLWHQSLYVTASDQRMSHNQWPLLLASMCDKIPRQRPPTTASTPATPMDGLRKTLAAAFDPGCKSVQVSMRSAATQRNALPADSIVRAFAHIAVTATDPG